MSLCFEYNFNLCCYVAPLLQAHLAVMLDATLLLGTLPLPVGLYAERLDNTLGLKYAKFWEAFSNENA